MDLQEESEEACFPKCQAIPFNPQCPVILLTRIMVLFQYAVIRHFIHLAAQLTSFDVQLLYLSIILLGVNIEQRKES